MPQSLESVVAAALDVQVDELDDGTPFERLAGWDSQRQIELAFALEHAYGISFEDGQIERLDDLPAVRAALKERGVSDA